MKVQIVFVMPSLDAGGGEKSLVNLLNTIDYSRYSVDLVLLHKQGIFIDLLPTEVRIVDVGGNYSNFTLGLVQSLTFFLKNGKLALAFNRLLFALKNAAYSNKAVAEQQSWKNKRASIATLEKKYDAAIGFLEKSSIYFVADKINARVKIGWIHTNYSNSGMDKQFDLPYFQKMDSVVAVSKECKENLVQNFPTLKSRFTVVHNIVSADLVRNLAQKPADIQSGPLTIVTIARLSSEKGIDIAIEACALLKEMGNPVNWLVIGEGRDHALLETQIKNRDITANFKLLGLKQNPYPYIKSATIYVQPSRYEGKSIAVDEAKILGKPIIVTSFLTAADQIENLKNGIIAEMNPKALAEAILRLVQDVGLQQKFSRSLSEQNWDTKKEINKFYELLNAKR